MRPEQESTCGGHRLGPRASAGRTRTLLPAHPSPTPPHPPQLLQRHSAVMSGGWGGGGLPASLCRGRSHGTAERPSSAYKPNGVWLGSNPAVRVQHRPLAHRGLSRDQSLDGSLDHRLVATMPASLQALLEAQLRRPVACLTGGPGC